MRNRSLSWMLAAACLAFASGASAGHPPDSDFDFSIAHDRDPENCSDLVIRSRGHEVVTESHSLAVTGSTLSIDSSERGGISVLGTNDREYGVVACLAAAGPDRAAAQERLAAIRVENVNGAVRTAGPSGGGWMAYLIVRAPRGAAMDVAIRNGPLSMRGTSGKFSIHGTNGPVSLDEVDGVVSVELENGPVSVSNGGGEMRVRTRNGPISVNLEGAAWRGEGLDARAVNGPLALEVSSDYRGGIRIESSGNAPWSCGGPCRGAERGLDDDGRHIEIGPQPATVRLSTVNGPVAIDGR